MLLLLSIYSYRNYYLLLDVENDSEKFQILIMMVFLSPNLPILHNIYYNLEADNFIYALTYLP